MAIYEFGTGIPKDDPYIYAVHMDGSPMIAGRNDHEFRTHAQLADEIAVRGAHNDQVLAEWVAAVDREQE